MYRKQCYFKALISWYFTKHQCFIIANHIYFFTLLRKFNFFGWDSKANFILLLRDNEKKLILMCVRIFVTTRMDKRFDRLKKTLFRTGSWAQNVVRARGIDLFCNTHTKRKLVKSSWSWILCYCYYTSSVTKRQTIKVL